MEEKKTPKTPSWGKTGVMTGGNKDGAGGGASKGAGKTAGSTAGGKTAGAAATGKPSAPAAKPAAPASAPASGSAENRYTQWHDVVSGDTLWKIAKQHYGDGNLYMEIFNANKDVLTDPDKIQVGQRLRIP